jgi:hypothetical protein
VGRKSPEEQLDAFLALLPPWARRLVESDWPRSKKGLLAWEEERTNWEREHGQLDWDLFRKVHQRCAQLRMLVPHRQRKWSRGALRMTLPQVKPGRPRKDSAAEEFKRMHEAGKSYREIAIANLSERLKTDLAADSARRELTIQQESERIRKLLQSRRHPSPPDKT